MNLHSTQDQYGKLMSPLVNKNTNSITKVDVTKLEVGSILK
jgi:hypothetical protein